MSPPGSPDGLELTLLAGDDEGHDAELAVSEGSPWFDGHFPGHPVLPAIAQVEVAARLHREAGERGYLAGIDALRFSEPVLPGDRLRIRLGVCDEHGRGRLRLTRAGDGVEIGSGTLIWGSPSADEVRDPPEVEEIGEAVAAELPHAGPSRLLEAAVAVGPGQTIGHGRVPAAHAAAHDGRVPALLALELAAQAAAQVPQVQEAGGDREAEADGGETAGGGAGTGGGEAGADPSHGRRLGYLVRLRDVRFARTEIEVDAPLVAHVDLAGRTGPLARFDFVVALPTGEPIAGGSLATWEVVDG